MTPIDNARQFASHGWKVFPCAKRGKVPACYGGCLSATDASGFDTLFADQADANYGIATGTPSGVWVLDIDGPQGVTDLEALEKKHGRLPATFTVQTGSGGFHLYFRMPSCGDVRNTQHLAGLSIDIRGTGGYVIGPGCIHPNGTEYTVTDYSPPAHAGWLYSLLMDRKSPASTTPRRSAPRVKRPALCNSEVFAVMQGYF